MGHLILPGSTGWSKPPGGLRVRWGHPLADRLLWAAAPGAGSSNDLIEGQQATLLANGNWAGATAIGEGLNSASTADGGAAWPWTDRLASLTDEWTIAVWLDPTTLVSSSHLLDIPYRAAGWTTPYHGLNLMREVLTGRLTLEWASSAADRNTATSPATMFADTDPLSLYLVTRQGSVARFFKNAAQIGANVTGRPTTSVDLSGKQPITLLNRSSTSVGEGIVGVTPLAAVWGRALRNDEIAWLAAEPYAFVQPAARRWFVSVIGAAAFDPATGFDWSEQPQSWTQPPWLAPDASVEGPVPLANAATASYFDWDATFDRDLTVRWFQPDASIEGFLPLANAPTHPDLGWDVRFDINRSQRWFTPEPYVESPLPLASPLTPLAADLLAGLWPDQSGQQDRGIQPVWFRPDDPQEGLVPPPFDPSIGFDWTDGSGQQDRSIQPVWQAPDAETQLLQTIAPPPTTATVDQQAALWPEQPVAWQAPANITNAIEPWFMGLNINLYAPAPGATPSVLINAENGDVYLYIGNNFIVPAS